MTTGQKILNVFGVLAAIPLSLILLAWLICAPMLASAASMVRPDHLRSVAESLDFSALMEGVEGDIATEALVKTETMGELVGMYVEDVLAQTEGSAPGTVLNEASVRATVEAHMDELIVMLRLVAEQEGVTEPITDEMARQLIQQILDENLTDILSELPTAEDIGLKSEEVMVTLTFLRSSFMVGVVIVAAILSLLLFVFRLYRFRGFVWLSVIYLLAAGFTALVHQGLGVAVQILTEGNEQLAMLVSAVLSGGLMWGAVALAVVGVLCAVCAWLAGRSLNRTPVPAVEPYGAGGYPMDPPDPFAGDR